MKKLNCQSPANMQLFQAGVLSRHGFHGRNLLLFSEQRWRDVFASRRSPFSGQLLGTPVLTRRGKFPLMGAPHLAELNAHFGVLLCASVSGGSAGLKVISLPASRSPSFQDIPLGRWAVSDRRAWEGRENRWSCPLSNTGETDKGK